MAFRRFRSFRGRSSSFSSRFRRRGPKTHAVTRTRMWEKSHFFLDNFVTLPGGSGSETMLFNHLASIATSLASSSSTSVEQRTGAVLANMERRLEIGGIVYDWGYRMLDEWDATEEDVSANSFHAMMALVTDRQGYDTSNVTFPASVGSWSPWLSQFPTAIYSSAGTPALDAEPVTTPTRIHLQKFWQPSTGGRVVTNSNEARLYGINENRLEQNFATVNRRLKLSLDDEQGLYLCWGTRNSATYAPAVAQHIQFWAAGKLYYRFRQ